MGETEPKSDYSLTHDLCPGCRADMKARKAQVSPRTKEIVAFFQELSGSVRISKPFDRAAVLKRAQELQIPKSSLLMGIMQPLLYQIGAWYQAGQITVIQEHIFTQAIDELIRELRSSAMEELGSGAQQSDIVIGCADGNYHYFGVRFLELALREKGFSAQALFPSLPMIDLFRFGQAVGAKIIGISATLPEQLDSLKSLDSIRYQLGGYSPFLILGGQAVTALKFTIEGAYSHDGKLENLFEVVRRELEAAHAESPTKKSAA
jgi:methanogenic corrinoid protein MtbC1